MTGLRQDIVAASKTLSGATMSISEKPRLIVVAGPNGSDKTSITE